MSSRLLPKSGLARAVTYASNQWRALCQYTEDGRLTIDNHVSERRLRDQAIGRKYWMFLGSTQAGPRAAVLCTIIAGAKRHRLEPWAYVRDVISQLSVDASPDRLAGRSGVLTRLIQSAGRAIGEGLNAGKGVPSAVAASRRRLVQG